MTTATRVVDTNRPGEAGNFIRWGTHLGRRVAVVRFQDGTRMVPEARLRRASRLPMQEDAQDDVDQPMERGKPGPKPRGLTREEYDWLLAHRGVTPDELERRARMTGLSLRQALEAFREGDCRKH